MKMFPRSGLILMSLLAGLVAANVQAQLVPLDGRWVSSEEAAAASLLASTKSNTPPASPSPGFGTASTSTLAIGACEAIMRDNAHPVKIDNCVRVEPVATGAPSSVGFPVHLPSGALVTSVTMHFFDDNPAGDISVGFQRTNTAGGFITVASLFTGGSVTGGDNSFTATLPTPHQVDNAAGNYVILALLHKTATSIQAIRGFEIRYRLQVSPAPATATFLDVPVGNAQHRFVEALVAAGITAGCGGGNFCPTQPVTRGQMAVFLATALGLHFPN